MEVNNNFPTNYSKWAQLCCLCNVKLDYKVSLWETIVNVHDFYSLNLWRILSGVLGWSSHTVIGSRQKLNSLSAIPALGINGTQLNRVNFTKSLGVLIDENLTWSNHITATCITKNISSGIGSIKRISHCVTPATLYTIYHGLVQSHFDYCSVVWGNCAKTLSDKLQRLQNLKN